VVDSELDFLFNLQCLQKKSARKRFRRSILNAWPECGYCGRPKPSTLDHIVPKSRGGETVRRNLIGACGACNLEKSDQPWFEWYRGQMYWTPEREDKILGWVNQPDPIPSLSLIKDSNRGSFFLLPEAV
jgi:hypothetical protein